jgi:hypothetical protein
LGGETTDVLATVRSQQPDIRWRFLWIYHPYRRSGLIAMEAGFIRTLPVTKSLMDPGG